MPTPAIIAATDFTPRSAHVAGRAALVAQCLHARLLLAHAATAPQPAVAEGAAVTEAEAEATGTLARLSRSLLMRPRKPGNAEKRLSALARTLGPEVEYRLLYGAANVALSELADEENALLLVLGLHRERRVLDILRLTTMERIVLDATTPVLIAHQRPSDHYRCVLALTDFSPASAAALRMAARIAPGASFHAIHALQLPLGARFSPGDAATDAAITRAEQLRGAFLAMPGLPELGETPEIVPGGVHEILAFRRNELQADLLCIGTHSGRDPSQLGNYARDLMRAPPTDLLVAKPA
ncbi:MAG: universal stress protein [Pararhodobacter sp.]|nr:universal stress protein [Pararhodobacter sp.]